MMKLRTLSILLFTAVSMRATTTLLTEGFTSLSALPSSGWVFQNNSTPPATSGWFQGSLTTFSAQSGPSDSYAAANFLNATYGGNISNWMLTPEVSLDNGDVFTFWFKADNALPDSVELRLSTNGLSTNVGTTDSSVGDFTTLLGTVSTYGFGVSNWVPETAVLSGLTGPTTGRFGFRYKVTDTSMNGDYIGIDTVSFATPEPGSIGLALIGAVVASLSVVGKRRRANKPRIALNLGEEAQEKEHQMRKLFYNINQLTTLMGGALLCGSLVLAQDSANSADKHKTATPKPETKAPGVVVFVDPATHQIRPAERGEVSTLTTPKPALKPSAKARSSSSPKIAATSRVIAGPSGSKGVVLGQDMMQFMVVTKDANGVLKEDCVNGGHNASQAITAQPVHTQTPGELDVQ